ncbi:MAG: hypothetical protein MJK11_16500, partial [Pseudomonadales bacterium]|nr:hypothetical protein [Pseudomonadales bacterium]
MKYVKFPNINYILCSLFVTLFIFSACSEKSPDEISPDESVFTVFAGDDQSIQQQSQVILNAIVLDVDDQTLTLDDVNVESISWKQTSGTPVEIVIQDSQSISFEAPNITEDETLVFEISLLGVDGQTYVDTVNVFIVVFDNQAPVITFIEDQSIFENNILILDSEVSDTDGSVVEYIWSQQSTALIDLKLENQNTSNITLNIGEVLQDISTVITLTVIDNQQAEQSISFNLNITDLNIQPTIELSASVDISMGVNESQILVLTALSTDMDGSIKNKTWAQLEGSSIVLTEMQLSQDAISFTLPEVITTQTIIFRHTVIDNHGFENYTDIQFDVNPINVAPIANAGLNQQALRKQTVQLDGSLSLDVDEDNDSDVNEQFITSYQWTQNQSDLLQVAILNADNQNANITLPFLELNDLPKTLNFILTVTDNEGLSHSNNTEVEILALNHFPTVNTGDDFS